MTGKVTQANLAAQADANTQLYTVLHQPALQTSQQQSKDPQVYTPAPHLLSRHAMLRAVLCHIQVSLVQAACLKVGVVHLEDLARCSTGRLVLAKVRLDKHQLVLMNVL
jgi:hypothetical protein